MTSFGNATDRVRMLLVPILRREYRRTSIPVVREREIFIFRQLDTGSQGSPGQFLLDNKLFHSTPRISTYMTTFRPIIASSLHIDIFI